MRVWGGQATPIAVSAELNNVDFDRDIAIPYKFHMITRADAQAIIRVGLDQAKDSYMRLVEQWFNQPKSEYNRVIDVMRRNNLFVDYRP